MQGQGGPEGRAPLPPVLTVPGVRVMVLAAPGGMGRRVGLWCVRVCRVERTRRLRSQH